MNDDELQNEFKQHCEQKGISFDDIEEVSDRTYRELVFWYKDWTFKLTEFNPEEYERHLYLVEYSHNQVCCSTCNKLYRAPSMTGRPFEIVFPGKITNDNFKDLPNEIKEELLKLFNSIIFNEKFFPFLQHWKEENEDKKLNT